MQIENSVKLDGPLSRNRSLRRLKPGDSVNVKVLTILDRYTADIDLMGNRVRASFQGGVPEAKTLLLQILGNKNGSLVFNLPGEGVQGVSYPQFLLAFKGMETYLQTLYKEVPDIFSLFRGLFWGKQSQSSGTAALYSRLLKKFSTKTISKLSHIISPGSRSASVIIDLIEGFSGSQTSGETDDESLLKLMDTLDKDDVISLINAIREKEHMTYVFGDGESPVVVELMENDNFIVVRLTLTGAGEIQIAGMDRNANIDLHIFFEQEQTRLSFAQFREELDSRLGGVDKHVGVFLHSLHDVCQILNNAVSERIKSRMVDFMA